MSDENDRHDDESNLTDDWFTCESCGDLANPEEGDEKRLLCVNCLNDEESKAEWPTIPSNEVRPDNVGINFNLEEYHRQKGEL